MTISVDKCHGKLLLSKMSVCCEHLFDRRFPEYRVAIPKMTVTYQTLGFKNCHYNRKFTPSIGKISPFGLRRFRLQYRFDPLQFSPRIFVDLVLQSLRLWKYWPWQYLADALFINRLNTLQSNSRSIECLPTWIDLSLRIPSRRPYPLS